MQERIVVFLIILSAFVAFYGLVEFFYNCIRIRWIYKPLGQCPVQSEGYFLGYYFYFRSRWDKAKIEFSDSKEDWDSNKIIAVYTLYTSKNMFSAGWLEHWKCRLLIYKGCILFLFKLDKKWKERDLSKEQEENPWL
jgi:hypothetical protein